MWKKLSVLCLVLPLNVEADDSLQSHSVFGETYLVSDYLSLNEEVVQAVGTLVDLTELPVRYMAVSPNGRNLFFGNEASDFKVLDTLSGRRLFRHAVPGVLKGIFWNRDNEIAVLTSEEFSFFDVSSPFEPEESETYELPTNQSISRQVSAGCFLNTNRYVVLESDVDRDAPQLRLMQRTQSSLVRTWAQLFPDFDDRERFRPERLLCGDTDVLLLMSDTSDDDFGEYRLMRLSGTSLERRGSDIIFENIEPEHQIKTLTVSGDKERLVVLYERREGETTSFLSKIVEYSLASFSVVRARFFEEVLVSLVSLMRGNTERNIIFSEGEEEGEFWLQEYAAQELASLDLEEGRLVSLTSDFSRLVPEAQGSSDHFFYALLGSKALNRFSKASRFEIESFEYNPPQLSFQILPSEQMRFEFRFKEEPVEGATEGPSANWGRSITSKVLAPSDSEAARTIVINTSELFVKSNRRHEVVVFAYPSPGGSASLAARESESFVFDPPPLPVTNFRLGFGDLSLHVFFQTQESPDDLSHFYIHLSTDASDLSSLPNSEEEIESSEREISLANDEILRSPVRVDFNLWRGRQIFSPLPNGSEIFVRVQVVDETGQFSSSDPAALGIRPARTRSLESAFGGTQSCQISIGSWHWSLFAYAAFLLSVLFLFRRSERKLKIK